METQESVQIRKYEDGQKELGKILKKRQAFIYIDNVLDQVELEHLLPESEDLHEAKKVRFLLTARDKNAKLAFPSSVSTQIYDMKGIKNPQAARSILEKETLEGLDSSKLDQIIKKCDGLPLLLKLVARFIGHAGDKGAAYDKLMQKEEIWNNEKFKEMSLRLAYDALPEKCKDPFLDICSYFRRWDWDTVENIVGKNELEMLESRALVTKDTFNGVVNVHDVILELGRSKGKEVRLTFSSARNLMAHLEEKKESAEGIKGIWLSGNKDVLRISATTLDSMHKSLRVLQLGDLTEVEGKCSKIFEELVFFEAKVRQLPFHDMSKLKQLKYLRYAPNELKLSKEVSISENNKENMKTRVLSELDRLLTNGRGEPVHLPNTSALLIFDFYYDKDRFPWPLIEETVDDGMQIKIIHIGPHFDQLPTKVKDTIFGVHTSENRLRDIWRNMMLTREGDVEDDDGRYYLHMDANMVGDGNSDNYAPCFWWRLLKADEIEEFVLCNSGRYLRLKQLQAETDEESSNIELLIELFAPDGD